MTAPVTSARVKHGLAVGLSGLGGFTDALGYLALGGVFVSFMSGNSTLLGIAGAEAVEARVALAGGLVAAFVGGVMVGTWVGRPCGVRRAPAILVLVAAILSGAAILHALGHTVAAGVLVALGMGAENTVFQKEGQPGMGLTYMTGTLVRMGQRAAEGAWHAVLADLLLWGGMVLGALVGALVFAQIGLHGVWVAVAVLLCMAVTVRGGVP